LVQAKRNDVRGEGVASMKVSISVAEITADLRHGLSDAELMRKYGLSKDGLKKVFDRLLRAACNGSRHIEVEINE